MELSNPGITGSIDGGFWFMIALELLCLGVIVAFSVFMIVSVFKSPKHGSFGVKRHIRLPNHIKGPIHLTVGVGQSRLETNVKSPDEVLECFETSEPTVTFYDDRSATVIPKEKIDYLDFRKAEPKEEGPDNAR